MFSQLTKKHVVVLPEQPVYSVDNADGMPLYSMDDAHHGGAMGAIWRVSAELGSRANDKELHHIRARALK
ncbi:hypothetical protein I6L39_15490 [Aeromonas sp. FDAARGOS 1409]|uniref:hypothetical protein n=1 Tax=Aeromonas TaxID=642 RepID=UPI001C233351|nr:hypothetical protein [Aeromonas sp. FDAARGOS 1409]QXC29307.1 hypothetical protein I6L39_15490 [Aeromonas sp. FDAARGOS 1409]